MLMRAKAHCNDTAKKMRLDPPIASIKKAKSLSVDVDTRAFGSSAPSAEICVLHVRCHLLLHQHLSRTQHLPNVSATKSSCDCCSDQKETPHNCHICVSFFLQLYQDRSTAVAILQLQAAKHADLRALYYFIRLARKFVSTCAKYH